MKGQLINFHDLAHTAAELVHASQGEKVWLFFGDIGSGKTTIIKHVCAHLGVKECVSSPTFTIINEYGGAKNSKFYHFDFYRLTKESELYDLGVEEYLESGAYCFIEWPEILKSAAPEVFFKVVLHTATPSERIIDYTLTTL